MGHTPHWEKIWIFWEAMCNFCEKSVKHSMAEKQVVLRFNWLILKKLQIFYVLTFKREYKVKKWLETTDMNINQIFKKRKKKMGVKNNGNNICFVIFLNLLYRPVIIFIKKDLYLTKRWHRNLKSKIFFSEF